MWKVVLMFNLDPRVSASDWSCASDLITEQSCASVENLAFLQSQLVKIGAHSASDKKGSTKDHEAHSKSAVQSIIDKVPEHTDLALPPEGCGRLFIDLGASVGDTLVRFARARPATIIEDGDWAMSTEVRPWSPRFPSFVESWEQYPNFDYRLYDLVTMRILNATESLQNEYCFVGVDANPYWKPHYDLLEKHLSKEFEASGPARVSLHAGLAAGFDQPRTINFRCSKFSLRDLEQGSPIDSASDYVPEDSADAKDGSRETCLVPVFDVEAYLQDLSNSPSPPTTLILKVDLEGAERNILRRLINNRAFCKFPMGTDIHLIAHDMNHFIDIDRSPAGKFPCGVRIYTVHPGAPCRRSREPYADLQHCADLKGWPWALQD